MRFITMRKQVHICFYQVDFQSGTRLVKTLVRNLQVFQLFCHQTEILHILQLCNMIVYPYACLHIVFLDCKFRYMTVELFS